MKLRIVCPRAVVRRGRSRARLLALSAAGALAVTAVTALGPGGPAAMAFSVFNPAITVADGNSVIAVHTSGNGLRFYWNEFGTNNWHGEQVAADGTTFSGPAIAQVGNTVVIAAEGIYNSLDLYWQTNGASGWNAETVATIRTTYSAPSIAQNGNSTIIAAEGPSNSLDFYWAFNGTSNWGPEQVAGAGTTYSAPSIATNTSGNGVNIAAEGPSNSLDFYWAINGTATWHPEVVAGAGTTATAPAISAHDNGVTIVALNQGGYLSTSWWATNGTAGWVAAVFAEAGGLSVQVTLVWQAARAAGRFQIAFPGGRVLLGHLQQVGPDGVETVAGHDPLVGGEAVEQVQPGAGAARHGHRDSMVQCCYRVTGDLQQQLVQGNDLRPVRVGRRGRFVVDRSDGCLQLVGPGRSLVQSAGQQRHAFADECGVPLGAVLLGHRDRFPGWAGACRAAGVGEQHQRQQPGHLGVAGQQPVQDAGQPDRLDGQVRADQPGARGGGIALGEDQVQRVQDCGQPAVPLVASRKSEWDTAVLDRLLGAGDAPGHGCLWYQEGPRNLVSGQAADGTEREGDL
jgi:hypothetical protein